MQRTSYVEHLQQKLALPKKTRALCSTDFCEWFEGLIRSGYGDEFYQLLIKYNVQLTGSYLLYTLYCEGTHSDYYDWNIGDLDIFMTGTVESYHTFCKKLSSLVGWAEKDLNSMSDSGDMIAHCTRHCKISAKCHTSSVPSIVNIILWSRVNNVWKWIKKHFDYDFLKIAYDFKRGGLNVARPQSLFERACVVDVRTTYGKLFHSDVNDWYMQRHITRRKEKYEKRGFTITLIKAKRRKID